MRINPLITLPNYEATEKLGEGPLSTVYKGFHKQAPFRPLVLKILKPGAISESRKNYFRQKIEHLKILNDPRLIPPLSFEEFRGTQLIVREYFNGLPLDQWAAKQQKITLKVFFKFAKKMADMLDAVHRCGIIHGGIKPHNILVQPDTLELSLIDFITPLDVRNISHFIYDRSFVEGTLAYTSPEQTGRINHRVDFTTDIYSTGIIFYELLTRKLPFFSTDPLELIHSHLAEEAPPVHELNPEVPPILSKIISKLILKQPEKRYQSGSGLITDLIQCEEALLKPNGYSVDFPLGTRDRTHRVTFVSKMVGRDQEAQTILQEYDRAAKGEFRSVLISGFSGIGKTRLIQELQRPIVRNRGYFTSGKFDVYQKNIPYSSLIQAFRNLMRTFLTESDERVAHWREKILSAVGRHGRVITDVVPELEILIGMQPEVSPLPPVEARNRFHDVFSRFLGCLASEESPLVLFIDDLQWCDIASFDFLTTIFSDHKEHPYLFLLGAYRHNEVDSSHPLAKLIQECKSHSYPLKEIRLGALKTEHSHEMVSYILDSPLEHTAALAGFIADLTEGNPLFVSESLSYLYNEQLLHFSDETQQWKWDLERIRNSNMPSSVVTLFSAKVQKLPPDTIDLLEYCACMGNLFTPDDVSLVREISLLHTFETLKPALGQGLLMENKDQLQFVHDKVQEACLSAIPASRRKQIHSQVGRHLLSRIPVGTDPETLDNLFTIVSHLNLGREPQLSREAAYELSGINFHAGNKALDSLATEAANEYFHNAIDLLPDDCWTQSYNRTFNIYKKLAKTELMVGNYESSERLLNQLLDQAQSDLDKAEALAEQTTSLSSIGNFNKAIETANRGLAYFKKSLPADPAAAEKKRDEMMSELNAKYEDVWSKILNMPFTHERKSKIELAFYSELIPDLYMSGLVPQLYLSAVQSTQHCLAGGMDESVIYSFSIMGLYLGEKENFDQAFKYEDLAKNLSEKYPNTFGATRGMNGVVWCNMHSRNTPAEIVNYCLKSIQSGRNCGDLYNAGLSYGPLMWNLQVQGRNFQDIESYAKECLQFSQKYHLSFSVGLAEAVQAGWIEPMKKNYTPVPMEANLKKWEEANHIASAGSYFVHLAIAAYYFHEYETAEKHLQAVNRYLSGLTDNVLKRQWYVFRALNALQLHASGLAYKTREELLAYVDPIQSKIETWANLGPLLRPYLAFLRAERERHLGSAREARNLYLDALDSAHSEQYTFLEGFINETLAEFLKEQKQSITKVYLNEAARLYRACHADRKEIELLEKYPEIDLDLRHPLPSELEVGAGTYLIPNLDIQYLMKSALAISAEIKTDALQKKIMNAVLEASGAQHGYLIIEEDGDLQIRAESHVTEKDVVKTVRTPLKEATQICHAIVRYVHRTRETLLLKNAMEDPTFKDNPEVQTLQLRSVYCLPLFEQSRMVGILYLENRLSDSVFTEKRAEMTRLLASQAAISLENARLVESMKIAEDQIKASLREKELLLKEVHHRVKNNLQVISSLFNLQSKHIKDRQILEMFRDSQNRVRSMAFVHEKLHQSTDMARIDFAGYVRVLAANLFRSYGVNQNQIHLQFDISNVSMSIETAIPLGLIINEIVSNSLKHAFPPGRSGEIYIGLRVDSEYKLLIRDNGIGLPPGVDIKNTNTLGLQLISTLTEQLGGKVTVLTHQGTHYQISWPIPKSGEKGLEDEKIKSIGR